MTTQQVYLNNFNLQYKYIYLNHQFANSTHFYFYPLIILEIINNYLIIYIFLPYMEL